MKKIMIVGWLFVVSVINAFTFIPDSLLTAKDSVNISAMVQAQIDIARLKAEINANNAEPVKQELQVKQTQTQESSVVSPFWSYVAKIPWQLIVLGVSSLLIISTIFIRRTILSAKRKNNKELKRKIGLMRDEKVVVNEDPKLNEKRKKLKSQDSLFNKSSQHITKFAKDMSIAKGEVMLAARLKYYESGKY